MDPTVVAQAELAQRVAAEGEAVVSQTEDESDGEEERARGGTAGEQGAWVAREPGHAGGGGGGECGVMVVPSWCKCHSCRPAGESELSGPGDVM